MRDKPNKTPPYLQGEKPSYRILRPNAGVSLIVRVRSILNDVPAGVNVNGLQECQGTFLFRGGSW